MIAVTLPNALRTILRWWPFLALLAALEICTRAGIISPNVLPPPTSVLRTIWDETLSGSLPKAAWASLQRISAGFAIAAVIGLSAAVLTAISPLARRAVQPIVELCRPISPIAWIPFAIVLFYSPSVFIVFIAAVFPIYVNATFGLANTPAVAMLAARSLHATTGQLVAHVIVPAALPAIMSGLRLGLGFAWTSVIAAELVAVQSGLGYEIQLSRLAYQPKLAVAYMVVVGVLGLAMSRAFVVIERRIVPWGQYKNRPDL
jgi:ABC-type nitrate/sulfonate/bicarbonate transport system permease component